MKTKHTRARARHRRRVTITCPQCGGQGRNVEVLDAQGRLRVVLRECIELPLATQGYPCAFRWQANDDAPRPGKMARQHARISRERRRA